MDIWRKIYVIRYKYCFDFSILRDRKEINMWELKRERIWFKINGIFLVIRIVRFNLFKYVFISIIEICFYF